MNGLSRFVDAFVERVADEILAVVEARFDARMAALEKLTEALLRYEVQDDGTTLPQTIWRRVDTVEQRLAEHIASGTHIVRDRAPQLTPTPTGPQPRNVFDEGKVR